MIKSKFLILGIIFFNVSIGHAQNVNSRWFLELKPLALHLITPLKGISIGMGAGYKLDNFGKTKMYLATQFLYLEEFPGFGKKVSAGKGIAELHFSRDIFNIDIHQVGIKTGIGYFQNLWENGELNYSPPLPTYYRRESSFFDKGMYLSLGLYWQKKDSPLQISIGCSNIPLVSISIKYFLT